MTSRRHRGFFRAAEWDSDRGRRCVRSSRTGARGRELLDQYLHRDVAQCAAHRVPCSPAPPVAARLPLPRLTPPPLPPRRRLRCNPTPISISTSSPRLRPCLCPRPRQFNRFVYEARPALPVGPPKQSAPRTDHRTQARRVGRRDRARHRRGARHQVRLPAGILRRRRRPPSGCRSFTPAASRYWPRVSSSIAASTRFPRPACSEPASRRSSSSATRATGTTGSINSKPPSR